MPGPDDDKDDDDEEEQVNFYDACHNDQVKLCPELSEDMSPYQLFNAKCFEERKTQGISSTCKNFYTKWLKQKAFLFGVMVSASIAMVFTGICTCLLFLCGIRQCVLARRRRTLQRLAVKETNKKSVPVDESALPILEQQIPVDAVPMQIFPPTAAVSPYSQYPQYWQPVIYSPIPRESGQ